MREAARQVGVQVVTGDTKVVDRGKGDQLFINTAGIGLVESAAPIAPRFVRPGDAVLLSGDIGRHGMAIMAVREGLEFESTIESDSCSVAGTVRNLLGAGIHVHCLRDLTRGGLATALVEIAEATRLSIEIDESSVPVDDRVPGRLRDPRARSPVRGERGPLHRVPTARPGCRRPACHELASPRRARLPHRRDRSAPGRASSRSRSPLGTRRVIDRLSGEQLPRIC